MFFVGYTQDTFSVAFTTIKEQIENEYMSIVLNLEITTVFRIAFTCDTFII